MKREVQSITKIYDIRNTIAHHKKKQADMYFKKQANKILY